MSPSAPIPLCRSWCRSRSPSLVLPPLAVEGAVSVTAENPLAVSADVSVDNKVTIGGKVDIQGKVKPTLLPVPGI